MIYVKTSRNQYLNYAEYNIGNNNVIQIEFEFRFPANLPNSLTPLLTTVNLYDSSYTSLEFINPGTVDISVNNLNVNKNGEKLFHLFFQTDFAINNTAGDREELEKILKECVTTYTISGGQDGTKRYSLYDSVSISGDKLQLFMFKQIELKK